MKKKRFNTSQRFKLFNSSENCYVKYNCGPNMCTLHLAWQPGRRICSWLFANKVCRLFPVWVTQWRRGRECVNLPGTLSDRLEFCARKFLTDSNSNTWYNLNVILVFWIIRDNLRLCHGGWCLRGITWKSKLRALKTQLVTFTCIFLSFLHLIFDDICHSFHWLAKYHIG